MPQDRIVALIDMDCFYVQVEQRCSPELWGKPTAVVQYNQWKKGIVIAVGYEARSKGVKRGMRGEEATEICPELNLVPVPCQRGKADLTKYRQASDEVFKTIFSFDNTVIERASIDEAYVDLTEAVENEYSKNYIHLQLKSEHFSSTFLAAKNATTNFDDWLRTVQENNDVEAIKLALGAKIVESMRQRILDDTKFHCSAGIAHNKMLAKLVCSLHKPKRQTFITRSMVSELFKTTPVQNVRLLGGKLGTQVVENLNVSTMAELSSTSLAVLERHFSESTAKWLHTLSFGEDDEPVIARLLAKSIGCSKNFPGKGALKTKKDVNHWLQQLCEELEERLTRDHQTNHRLAKTLIVGIRTEDDSSSINCSRQISLSYYSSDAFVKDCLKLLQEFNTAAKDSLFWKPAIVCLSVGATKFEDSVDVESLPITDFFKPLADRDIKDCDETSPSKAANPEPSELRPPTPVKNASKSFFGQIGVEKSPATKSKSSDVENVNRLLPCDRASVSAKPSSSKVTHFASEDVQVVDSADRVTPMSTCSTGSEDLFVAKRDDQTTKSGTAAADALAQERLSPEIIFLDVPDDRNGIDKSTWQALPPDIRFELTQYYKRHGKSLSLEATTVSKNNTKDKLDSKHKRKIKSPAKKPKKLGNSVKNGSTLLDYYDKL